MDIQEEPLILPKSSKRRWWLWLLASPFLLFFTAIVLLYLPPVQRFAVDKASTIASQATGLDISVGRLDLRFPLDLLVRDVHAVMHESGDTLLSLDRLKVELRLWKLFRKELEVEEISLQGATVNTRNFLDGMAVKGHLGELFLESHGVAFSPETARINEFSVKNTDLTLTLDELPESESTPSDTLYWKILLDEIQLENVGLALKMPKDSLYLRTRLPEASLRSGVVDLRESAYFVKTFAIGDASLAYDSGVEASKLPTDSLGKTLNPSHLAFESIDFQLDSVYYCGRDIRARISRFDFLERSGLELVSTEGRIRADEKAIRIPQLVARKIGRAHV